VLMGSGMLVGESVFVCVDFIASVTVFSPTAGFGTGAAHPTRITITNKINN
jgi:hypothetical protein